MNISQTLINWYSVNKRSLPWRNTTNPYYIWLSEIILQQTQVAQGLPYYEAFISRFPTVFDLANAQESEVLKLWQGLGYYSRARNLHFSAKYVANDLNGEFPGNFKELKELKGVGDYTASAIASICFNEPSAVVDGNVFRFLSRYFGISTPINTSKGFKEFKTLAQGFIDIDKPADFNQAIMEFGAKQCKPRSPDCTVCPFASGCIALQKHLIGELPVKVKALKVKKKYFNFIVILSEDNKTILEQRTGKGIWQNLYQFPLIETEKSASFLEMQFKLNAFESLTEKSYDLSLYNDVDLVHKLSHQHLYTKFWIVTLKGVLNEGVPLNTIDKFPVPILLGDFIETFNF